MLLRRPRLLAGLAVLLALAGVWPASALTGKVVNAESQAPIAGATVTLGDKVATTNGDGAFDIQGSGDRLRVRAPGFRRAEAPLEQEADGPTVALQPFAARALYLSVHGISSTVLRGAAMEIIQAKNANALVIDVKGDRGEIPFRVGVPLAQEIGAQRLITIPDIKALLAGLREQGVYTIARIVVFKDPLLATAKPELAVRVAGGGFFQDREHLRWVDPFRQQAWEYVIAVAKEAAEAGFDEVQFDYVRFPDNKRGVYAQPATEESRTEAITGFLSAARQALVPYNVFTAANIFGYVCWNQNDTDIGQKVDRVAGAVDILSPMLYPSGFQHGIPGYRNPVQNSYQIIHQSLKRCQERAQISPLRFRPWLQAFRDYAFGGKVFDGPALNQQVKATADFGSPSYMVWNPRNRYPTDGYNP